MKLLRLVIADRHPVVRLGLRNLLRRVPGMASVGEAQSDVEALDLVRRHGPDVLLLGMNLPAERSIEMARQRLRQQLAGIVEHDVRGRLGGHRPGR